MFLGDDVTDQKGTPLTTTPIAILKPFKLAETDRTIYVPFNPGVYLPTPEQQSAGVPVISTVKVPTAKKTGSTLIAVAGGAVAGGVVGGPPGALIGGIIGAVMAIKKG